MNLPVGNEPSEFIYDPDDMIKAVSEEDIRMFIIPGKTKISPLKPPRKSNARLGKLRNSKQTVGDHFESNKASHMNTKKVGKFLEQGVLDNVLFNFLFSRGLGLKNGLIDINRAFLMVKRINESELDFPEKVPDQPLNDDEKLEIVWDFMKKHPQLLLQAIPDKNNRRQRVFVPEKKPKRKARLPQLHKSAQNMKRNTHFRTIERCRPTWDAYKGNMKRRKQEFLRKKSNSPAVPMPSYSRFSSNSNRAKILENSITSDIKIVSQGINFEVEPLDNRNHKIRTSMSQNRPNDHEYLKDKIHVRPKAKAREVNTKSRLFQEHSPNTNIGLKLSISTKDKDSTKRSVKPPKNTFKTRKI